MALNPLIVPWSLVQDSFPPREVLEYHLPQHQWTFHQTQELRDLPDFLKQEILEIIVCGLKTMQLPQK